MNDQEFDRPTSIAQFLAAMGEQYRLTPWQTQLLGEEPTVNDPETDAINAAYDALTDLEYEAKVRALRYLIVRLGVPIRELSR